MWLNCKQVLNRSLIPTNWNLPESWVDRGKMNSGKGPGLQSIDQIPFVQLSLGTVCVQFMIIHIFTMLQM